MKRMASATILAAGYKYRATVYALLSISQPYRLDSDGKKLKKFPAPQVLSLIHI